MSWHDNLEEPEDGKSWGRRLREVGQRKAGGSENSQAESLQGTLGSSAVVSRLDSTDQAQRD